MLVGLFKTVYFRFDEGDQLRHILRPTYTKILYRYIEGGAVDQRREDGCGCVTACNNHKTTFHTFLCETDDQRGQFTSTEAEKLGNLHGVQSGCGGGIPGFPHRNKHGRSRHAMAVTTTVPILFSPTHPPVE